MAVVTSSAIGVKVADVVVPDSKLAREVTELVRDTEPPLLFHHSSRVYYWGALTGKRRGLRFDPELLYAGAMFHDMGLTPRYRSQTERFEVDSANTARDFLKAHNIAQSGIDLVWTAIAPHTTPGIPVHMHPVIALVTAGVEMDVLGIAYEKFPNEQRDAVVAAYSRPPRFQGGNHSGLLRRIQRQTRHDVWQRQRRRSRRQRPALPSHQFLQCDPQLGLARMKGPRPGNRKSAYGLW